jgi:outer membrane protein assembly factor BamB
MKVNRFLLFAALALLAAALSACGGTPAAASWPGLAADDKAAYLANGSVIYAIRIKDGEELWSFPEKPGAKLIFYANPVFTPDGNLLIGSSGADHTLFMLDPETGGEIWSFTEADDQWVASPLIDIDGNMAYAPNADGFLYAFDLSKEGVDKLAWKVNLGGKLWSSPVADGERIYVASLDHHLHAVDIATQEIVWVVELEGASAGAPALADGLIFVGSFGANFNAFHAADGSPAWSVPTKGWVWSGPTLVNSTLYVADLDGNLYTLNPTDGEPLADSIRPNGPILASPTFLHDRLILVTESGTIYAVNAEGKLESLGTLNGKLYTNPVAAGDWILVAPFKGDFLLAAIQQDGAQVWQYPKEEK